MQDSFKITRRLYGIIFFMLIFGLGISAVYRSGPHIIQGKSWGSKNHRTDFTVYQAAGRAVIDGTNIYEAHNPRDWYYMYLPVFACAMVPFSLLNEFWGSLIWYLLSAGMVAHGLYLSIRLASEIFPSKNPDRLWLSSLAGLLILWPTMSGLARGQASILLTYAVILSVSYSKLNRPWLSGFWLSCSIILKVFPFILLLYFIAKNKINLALAAGFWLAIFLFIIPSFIFGPLENLDLLNRWVYTIGMPANNPDTSENNIRYSQMINPRIAKNQSIQAVSIRWLAGATPKTAVPEREHLARNLSMLLSAGLVLITIWSCSWRTAQTRETQDILELSAIMLLMLFISPVSWTHNYTLATFPLSVAVVGATASHNRQIRKTFKVTLITFGIATIGSLTIKPLYIRGSFLVGNIVLWGALLLAIKILRKNHLKNIVPVAPNQ